MARMTCDDGVLSRMGGIKLDMIYMSILVSYDLECYTSLSRENTAN